MIEFFHVAPENYSYDFEEFKSNVVRIWINSHRKFDYNNGTPVRSVWGFYNSKKREYYAPVNSKTVGRLVNVENTTPYSAMIPKKTILESFFV